MRTERSRHFDGQLVPANRLMNSKYANRSYFFDGGIRFECTQCGACCTGEPGIVRATPVEVEAMARMLGIGPDRFQQIYLYRLGDDWGVKEEADGRCMLFGSDGCTIYSARPLQCRTFPFWPENLRSRYRWRQVKAACPGIGRGKLFDKETILSILAASMGGCREI